MSELIDRIEKIEKQGREQSELNKKLLLSLTRLDNKSVEFESLFNNKIEDISAKLVS